MELSAGLGTKGERWYEWAAMKLCWPASEGMSQYLLVRRNIKDINDISYYFCHASSDITVAELARAAGQRWHIGSCFEHAKQEIGLDEYEVRSWKGWYRHITLSMIGLLLLNIFKGLGADTPAGKKSAMVVLSVTESRHFLSELMRSVKSSISPGDCTLCDQGAGVSGLCL